MRGTRQHAAEEDAPGVPCEGRIHRQTAQGVWGDYTPLRSTCFPWQTGQLVSLTAKTVVERDSLFRGLPEATLERIAALGLRRVFEEGAVVFMRGDPGDSLCGVVTGRVRI